MATLFHITAPIYPHIFEEEETDVATAIAAAGTTLVVDNTDGFSANDYIVIGTLGKETAEIVKIASNDSDTQLTIAAVNFAHAVNEPVKRTPFNQVKFLQCSTATGTYAADGSAESMQVDNKDLLTGHQTTLASARDKYWKVIYYNSTSTNQTSESDATATLGSSVLYCSVQDVYDFLDLKDDQINANTVSLVIENVTKEIDSLSNSSFYTNTTTTEYHDGKGSFDDEYFLENKPVIAITTLETTQSAEATATPTWDTLTVVSHYELTLSTGRIAIVDSSYIPTEGRNRFRCTYTWGHAAVPDDIRKLAILMVSRDLSHAERFTELIRSSENIKGEMLGVSEESIKMILSRYRKLPMGNT